MLTKKHLFCLNVFKFKLTDQWIWSIRLIAIALQSTAFAALPKSRLTNLRSLCMPSQKLHAVLKPLNLTHSRNSHLWKHAKRDGRQIHRVSAVAMCTFLSAKPRLSKVPKPGHHNQQGPNAGRGGVDVRRVLRPTRSPAAIPFSDPLHSLRVL